MRQPRWIDWAIIALIGLILLIAASGAAIAAQSEPQITLAPGTWRFVEFTNDEDEPENLVIKNISAPDSLIPCLFVSPMTIPAHSSREVAFHFIQTQSIKENILPDNYALRVIGCNRDLLVYLDLSIPLPENAENRWAALDVRIDALDASLSGEIKSLEVRITLESENWALEIESLRENVRLGFDGLLVWIKSELARIEASIPENSPSIDTAEWEAMLDERETGLRMAFASAIADMKVDHEKQIADAKSETDQARYTSFAAIVVAIAAVAVLIIKSRAARPSPKTPPRFLKSEVAPEDRAAMLENEIGAMRERGEDADAIREKEQELATLKSQLKSKTQGGE